MLSYLGLIGSFLVPLVLYLIKKDESRYVRHHAAQAMNLWLSGAIYSVAAVVLFAVPTPLLDSAGVEVIPVVTLVLFYVAFLGNIITMLVFMILGAVKGSRGDWYRMPAWRCLHMIK